MNSGLLIGAGLVVGSSLLSAAQVARSEEHARLDRPELKQAIMGALLYLDDTQIRQRPGFGDPRYDACSGDGCAPTPVGLGESLPLPIGPTDNRRGEWANFIHVFPDQLQWPHAPWDTRPAGEDGTVIQVQDSNLFMAATTALPLYYFDESALRPGQAAVTAMRDEALASIRAYRHGQGFAFWPTLPGTTSAAGRVGPLNIPPALGYLQPVFLAIPGAADNIPPRTRQWLSDIFDTGINPAGGDAITNIPADADDTALATANFSFDARRHGSSPITPEVLATVGALAPWRDLGRKTEDGRDQWKGTNSGGFLTWLRDENLGREGRFADPEQGVIPLGVNNVDCVVNANALFALGLAGQGQSETARQVSDLLARAAAFGSWPECGLYYPQRQIFPYTLTRAYREGHVRNPAMATAMTRLLLALLSEQSQLAAKDPDRAGAFSGGADPTFDLATALGLSSLLNIGSDFAQKVGVLAQYQNGVEQALSYLLKSQQAWGIQFSTTFNRDSDHAFFPSPWDEARRWRAGVFFSASRWSLAQWRSEAYTTAMVLEALVKYGLEYDLRPSDVTTGAHLKVLGYARNAGDAAANFQLAPSFAP